MRAVGPAEAAFTTEDAASVIENGGPRLSTPTKNPMLDKKRQLRRRCMPCIIFALVVFTAASFVAADLSALVRASPANVTLVLSPPAHAPEGATTTAHLHGVLAHHSVAHTAALSGVACQAVVAGVGVSNETVRVATAQLDAPIASAAPGSRTGGSATLYAHGRARVS